MRTNTRRVLQATLMAAAVTGSLASGTVASARQNSTPGGCTAADRTLIEQLVATQAIFHNGTPGSPSQFRAREEADKLWEKLFPTG